MSLVFPAILRLPLQVPLTSDGELKDMDPTTIVLGGDFEFVSGTFNANGIVVSPQGCVRVLDAVDVRYSILFDPLGAVFLAREHDTGAELLQGVAWQT